ncbi:putative MFS family arabinose efflux permease [Silvimonas terrae]|uniref:Putative MFS family arabinose efflux permease n=1 Tax=Silvimonas terrae TaxID=300266 RepID=A0A840RF31_9NEIS|nr:MFS transporter [Silvimonas terrae]MBB5191174.1 putative MFS family arabinose efflux permease [Silvimonas terrae]
MSATTPSTDRLPLPALLALALVAFITVLTEALPAGLLRQMSAGLGVSEALAGQLVSLYALGTLLTAIPLTAATQSWRRRPLLAVAILGFAVTNAVTALSGHYELTLVARFFAGVFAGLLWSLVAGYASRLVPDQLKGRAMAIVMAGIPLALSVGIPAATFLGIHAGWRFAFGGMSLIALGLAGWMWLRIPDYPGQTAGQQRSIAEVFMLPGIRAVLFVTLTFVLAHNLLYTYIAPFLVPSGLADRVDLILLAFGIVALASVWVVGLLVDRWLRQLVLASTVLFLAAAGALGFWNHSAVTVFGAIAVWGLAWGGAATLFQTASAKTAGSAAEVAQSMIVTVWNIAMAAAGVGGGLLLQREGATIFPFALIALLLPALIVTLRSRRHGFPSAERV